MVQVFERTPAYILIYSSNADLSAYVRRACETTFECVISEFGDQASFVKSCQEKPPDALILHFEGEIDDAFLHAVLQIEGQQSRKIIVINDSLTEDIANCLLTLGIIEITPVSIYRPMIAAQIQRVLNASAQLQQSDTNQAILEKVSQAEHQQRMLSEALGASIALMSQSLEPDEVMHQILDNVGRVVKHDATNIMLIEGEIARVKFSRGYSPETNEAISSMEYPISDMPILHQAMLKGKPRRIDNTHVELNWLNLFDMEEAQVSHAYLCVPIKAHGQAIGFLNLDRFNRQNPFTKTDEEHIEIFANQAAIALVNADLYKAMTRDAMQMRHLQQATELLLNTKLLTSDNLPGVAAQIAEVVVQAFGKLDCGVILVDDTGKKLTRFSRAGRYDVQVEAPLHVDGIGLVPYAVRTGNVIHAPDVRKHYLYFRNDERTRSELVIPLKTSNGVIGVLDLQSEQLDAFSTQEIDKLQAFASHTAVVLENIQLVNGIRHVNETLEERVFERTSDLNRTRKRVEAILNSSSDAILMVTADKCIQQVNPAFATLFGYDEAQAIGLNIDALATSNAKSDILRAIDRALLTRANARTGITAQRINGTTFYADVMISPINSHLSGEITSVVCSVRDISEMKELERELETAFEREHELVELKSSFIRLASHEFRTPLSIIQTSVDILRMYGDKKNMQERDEKLSNIQAQVKQLKEMLDKLFELNRYQQSTATFRPRRTDIKQLCIAVLQPLQNDLARTHQVKFIVKNECHPVLVDSDILTSALRNLLINAVKFSDPNTLIQLELNCSDTVIEIQVSDQGIGIPAIYQKDLYEPFYRIREGAHVNYAEQVPGAGLGLTIVKQAVEVHGGTISFESAEGVGTTFIIKIPVNNVEETIVSYG